jgi:hypothetical protein
MDDWAMKDVLDRIPAGNPRTPSRLANWPTVQPIN